MVTTFKPGDLVIRTGKSFPNRSVYKNDIYTVKEIINYGKYLTLENRLGIFSPTRFRLLKSLETDKQRVIDANVIEF